jgi:O-antigen ligase
MPHAVQPRRHQLIAQAVAATLLLVALIFGGGSRGAGDAVVHLVAVPALALGLLRWRHTARNRSQRLFGWWLLAGAVLIAWQLLPLPTAWIAHLPQRAGIVEDLHRAGIAPQWMTPTLDRWGSIRSGLAFATFAAMSLLAITLDAAARRRLLKFACLAAVPMALLGFAQAAAGAAPALRFHGYYHPLGAIGLFANRNHFADLMAMLLPCALAFAADAQQCRQRPLAIAWSALAVLLLLAAALSFSRAGIALAAAASLAMIVVLWGRARGRQRLLPLATLAIAAIAVTIYAWDGIVTRLLQDPLDDLRWQYLHYGRAVLAAYWPIGSGLGSFRGAYAPFEPVAAMVNVHALHAHDDLLEVLIEAGAPGLALVAAFLALLSTALFRATGKFLHAGAEKSRTIHLAAALACAVPILHSLVDYPLRTLAIATVFGLVWSELSSALGAIASRPVGDSH